MKISDLCEFKYNYDFNVNNKHNIICIVLFRLKHLYRSFDKYMYGLDEIVKYTSQYDKIKNDIKFRILYNTSIFQTNNQNELDNILASMERASKNKHIQLVEFNCPNYKLDEIYDKGIFPVFLRYLYFFNFEDNDTNYIYASDIDFTPNKIEQNFIGFLINTFDNLIVNDINFSFHTSKCYVPFWKKKISKKDSISILGGVVGGNIKLNYKILINFLNDCKDSVNSKNKLISNFYKNYVEYINNKNIPKEYKKKKIKSYESDKIFVYGLDEFFLTYFVLPQILNDFKIKNIYQNVRNVASGGLSVLLEKLFKNVINRQNTDETTIIYNELLKNTIGTNIKKEYTFKKLLEFIKMFEIHDYKEETNKPTLYEKFYKNLVTLINSNKKKYLNLNNDYLFCFLLNDVYYTDKNNFNKISDEKRKYYYKSLTSI